jgi:hypothetical protein
MAKKWRRPGPLHKGIENPRHKVWIEDEDGLRQITTAHPGEAQILVGKRTYTHTREITAGGPWVYTREGP